MDINRLPKQALQYKPNGRRNIGRPRKRWRDQLYLEDQGTGNTPNPSGTWLWWWRSEQRKRRKGKRGYSMALSLLTSCHMASEVDEWNMSIKHWLSDNDRGKTEVTGKKKTCPHTTCPITNITWNGPGSKRGYGENDRIRHRETARDPLSTVKCVSEIRCPPRTKTPTKSISLDFELLESIP